MKQFRDSTVIYVKPDCDGKVNNGYAPEFKDYGFDAAWLSDGPVWCIEKALEIATEMREDGNKKPLTIKLMAGEYNLSKPLVIDHLMKDITIEPYGDGEVLISGGKKITGWKKDTFNGVECFSTFIPEVKEGKWNFSDFYVDGLRADFTRYPEDHDLTIVEAENPGHELFDHSKWFIAKKEDVAEFKNFRNFGDCFISFLHYWIDEHTPIESYDLETGKVVMKYASRFNINHNFTYYLENVAEMFAKKNQWYLDRPNGMLYYIPRNDEQAPETIEAYAPVTAKLIEFRGNPKNNIYAEYVRFRNINFAYTRGDYSSNTEVHGQITEAYASDSQAVSNAHGSISMTGARNCSFENCKFRNFGVHCITIDKGCSDIRITKNEFYDGGAGAIKICGGSASDPEYEHTHHCVISDNTIKHCGRRYYSACGILLMTAYNCEISHNDISDLFYTGISCGWQWGYYPHITKNNLITKNHIYNLGQGFLSDMGGVYLLGNQPGTVVSNNLIHDVICKEYGGWALYTDEGSAYITLENNICYNTSKSSYHQHYGTSNVVRNNVFALSKDEGAMRVSRAERHNSITFENNIFYTEGNHMYGHFIESLFFGNVISRKNLFFDATGTPKFHDSEKFKSFEAVREVLGMEEDSIIADPKFKDVKNYDFSLEDDSPAYKIDFKPIDISDVGPRK